MVAFLCLFKKAANHVVIAACTQHIFGKKKEKNRFTLNGGKKMTSLELLHFWKLVTQQHGGLEIMYHRADSNWRGNLLCFAFLQQSLLAFL